MQLCFPAKGHQLTAKLLDKERGLEVSWRFWLPPGVTLAARESEDISATNKAVDVPDHILGFQHGGNLRLEGRPTRIVMVQYLQGMNLGVLDDDGAPWPIQGA